MSMCYVGRCKCGRIVAACASDSEFIDAKAVARWIAGFIKDGLTVKQMDSEQVRAALRRCECKDIAESAPARQLELIEEHVIGEKDA